jgi:hypothetical protein
MILLSLMLVSAIVWDGRSAAVPITVVLALAALGTALGLGARRSGLARKAVTFVALEEALLAAALCGPLPGDTRLQAVALLAGGLLVATLVLGIRLPDGWAPLRGIWLRRLLAAIGLLAVCYAGPWLWLLELWQGARLPLWPLVPAFTVVGALMVLAGDSISRAPLRGWWIPRSAAAAAS